MGLTAGEIFEIVDSGNSQVTALARVPWEGGMPAGENSDPERCGKGGSE